MHRDAAAYPPVFFARALREDRRPGAKSAKYAEKFFFEELRPANPGEVGKRCNQGPTTIGNRLLKCVLDVRLLCVYKAVI